MTIIPLQLKTLFMLDTPKCECDNFHSVEESILVSCLSRNFLCGEFKKLFEMDPNYIRLEAWEHVSTFVTYIWLFVLSMVIFAANMLIGHNAIPSLIKSQHIPGSLNKIRIPLYGVSVVAFVAAVYFALTAFQGGRAAIKLIYPDFWI